MSDQPQYYRTTDPLESLNVRIRLRKVRLANCYGQLCIKVDLALPAVISCFDHQLHAAAYVRSSWLPPVSWSRNIAFQVLLVFAVVMHYRPRHSAPPEVCL